MHLLQVCLTVLQQFFFYWQQVYKMCHKSQRQINNNNENKIHKKDLKILELFRDNIISLNITNLKKW